MLYVHILSKIRHCSVLIADNAHGAVTGAQCNARHDSCASTMCGMTDRSFMRVGLKNVAALKIPTEQKNPLKAQQLNQ